MIKDGKGGAKTNKTGLSFEGKTDLQKVFENSKNYVCEKEIGKDYLTLKYKNKKVGLLLKKHNLYKYLEEKGINWKKYISSKLIPDDAIYVIHKNTIYIIEIKYQEVEGSTDEKLQTCDFKKKQYTKLFAPINHNVEYVYVLNDWFKKEKYKDVLDYIISVNCRFYFNYIPLELFGLKP